MEWLIFGGVLSVVRESGVSSTVFASLVFLMVALTLVSFRWPCRCVVGSLRLTLGSGRGLGRGVGVGKSLGIYSPFARGNLVVGGLFLSGRLVYCCERSEQLSARGLSPRTNRYKLSILFQKQK